MLKPFSLTLILRVAVLALLFSIIGFNSLNPQASAASDKLKVTALLIEDRDRIRACKGSFTQATVDYAIWKKGNPKVTGNVDRVAYWDEQCLIRVISNKPLSGTQFLQIKQGIEWVDICSLSFWAERLSKQNCSKKFGGKQSLGKVSGKNLVCTFKRGECLGHFDYGTPSLGVYTQTEGDFCLETSISKLELRVRVDSGTNQYVSNSVIFSYLNTDKVINKGDQCVLVTSSSSGELPGQGSSSGTSGTSLPQCSVAQIRQHSTLAKSFNEFRNMYLDSVDIMDESINGMNKTFISGNQTAYEGWRKNLVDSTALARLTATDAIDTQNKLIALMQQCAFNYGIVITQPYGFITTDENRRGYQFPSFKIP